MGYKRSVIFGVWLAAGVASLTGRAFAQTITVTTTTTTVANDAVCTIQEAVEAINRQASYNGCSFSPTASADRIMLDVAASNPDVFVVPGEMIVTRSMEVIGQGRSATTISTGGLYGFSVRGGATLNIQDLTLQRKPDQGLPVQGLNVIDGSTLIVDNLRIVNFNYGGIGVDGDGPEATHATVIDSTIENNTTVTGTGAGIFNTNGTVDVQNSIIRNNAADDGGGVFAEGDLGTSYVNLYDSLIEGNSASNNGGGLCSTGSSVNARINVYRSLINNNTAGGNGGGYYSAGQFVMYNTTIVNNWAGGNGAGLYHNGAEHQIHHSTIARNGGTRNGITTQVGGGLWTSGGNRLIKHTIIGDNSAVSAPDVNGTFLISLGYNLIENTSGSSGFGGTDVTGVDPQLAAALISLGGPTQVLPPLAGSPAIDKIPASVTPDSETEVDQRKSPRRVPVALTPRNGDSSGVGYDIGAVEQGAIEAEFLALGPKTAQTHTVFVDAAYWNNGGTRFDAAANGDYVTYAVPVLSTGTYQINLRVRRANNRGIYQVSTADSSAGSYTNRGAVVDLYAASPTFGDVAISQNVTFNTTGTKYLRFTVTGKNAASSARFLFLDYVQLLKQ